jgi:hypothetical protein
MKDEDLRDFFAGMALIGLVMREGAGDSIEYDAYAIADNMISCKYDPDFGKDDEAEPEVEEGITSIKPKRKVK